MRNCPTPNCSSSFESLASASCLPGALGKTSPADCAGVEPVRRRSVACRTSIARALSGTRCSRVAFIRAAGIVHAASPKSISSHRAPRASPGLTAVSTRNLERRLDTARPEPDARTVSMAAATPLWGRASRCVTMSFCGCRSADRAAQHAVAGIVVSQVHRNDPPQQGPDALVHRAGRLRLHVAGGRLDPQHIGGVDLRDQPPGRHGGRHSVRGWDPVLRIPPVARGPTLLFEHALAVLGESRNARRAALLRKRVATGPRQLPVGEVCSRAEASETSPAAPTDGIERGRSARTAPSGCATGPRAWDAKSTTGTKTTRTRRARGARRTTRRRRKEGYEGKRESTRCRSRSRPRAGSSRLGAMPPMRS